MASQAVYREASGTRPGGNTTAPPSMAGRETGERSESSALGVGNANPPVSRKRGPEDRNRRGGAPQGERAPQGARTLEL